jgi:hypothetical protein
MRSKGESRIISNGAHRLLPFMRSVRRSEQMRSLTLRRGPLTPTGSIDPLRRIARDGELWSPSEFPKPRSFVVRLRARPLLRQRQTPARIRGAVETVMQPSWIARTVTPAGRDRDDPPSAAATRSMSRRSPSAQVRETDHRGFRATDRRREFGNRGRSRIRWASKAA